MEMWNILELYIHHQWRIEVDYFHCTHILGSSFIASQADPILYNIPYLRNPNIDFAFSETETIISQRPFCKRCQLIENIRWFQESKRNHRSIPDHETSAPSNWLFTKFKVQRNETRCNSLTVGACSGKFQHYNYFHFYGLIVYILSRKLWDVLKERSKFGLAITQIFCLLLFCC